MGLKKQMLQFEDQRSDIESDYESDTEPVIRNPFRLLDLPSEIRLRIYHFVLFTPARKSALQRTGNVGASAKKSKPLAPSSHRVGLFLASKRIHDEATHHFYSTQTFRVLPVQDFLRMPTVRALPRRHRASITTIELIVGSSWTAPPKTWVINQGLGLQDMHLARTLKVFVQCDPSHPVFEGFRISKDFYTNFCGNLLHQILERLPGLVQVEFDGWPSVDKNGPLMSRLLAETRGAQKKVLWGPERGWSDHQGDRHKDHGLSDADAAFDGMLSHPPDLVEALSKSLQTVKLES
ncbi:hypothetical protein N7541_010067 [Penicillium brevicompactum]|uniref:F-box domain-containing protein n=1 Tax=Penicillium brevicompactum TaxID=5074 RepID=A0A9W9QTX8_PENBR|nr:uncharacterized protein N7506_010221 [Penicillium brevicompactum]KAJ5327119.1 hypothetical protein N7506_010221 [Penicillium brevicompactum]KAJ5340943.1 hypothetical protein N7541_010067 [Penicillium brevicompactum]